MSLLRICLLTADTKQRYLSSCFESGRFISQLNATVRMRVCLLCFHAQTTQPIIMTFCTQIFKNKKKILVESAAGGLSVSVPTNRHNVSVSMSVRNAGKVSVNS